MAVFLGQLPNHPPDDFGALGDDGVSEGSESLCPIGNPIIHSTNRGDSNPGPIASCIALHPAHLRILGASWFAFAVGVGVGSLPILASESSE